MTVETARVAICWDSSYLWGLIAYRSFSCLGLDFDLIDSSDIRAGKLDGFDILFVPGGWASDKILALGGDGAPAIRRFVGEGGSYLGCCGGAGLALSHDSGLGLASFGRLPTSQRLPSFSGRIVLEHTVPDHPMWRGIEPGAAFHAWWPGQFALDGDPEVSVLARYGEALAGSFVADLPVGAPFDWRRWEEIYGINLDPERIAGEPAVIEFPYGGGRAILSYLHFETPWDQKGNLVMLNLIRYLSGGKEPALPCPAQGVKPVPERERGAVSELGPAAAAAREMERRAWDFVHFGKQNFLWFWRTSWLLQWRRGVKGIEYSALYGMLAELDRLTEKYEDRLGADFEEQISVLLGRVDEFLNGARTLLTLERWALAQGPLSPLKSDDENINAARERLFSRSKRCGGLYGEIMERADRLLLPLIRMESAEAGGA
ncbi:MAG: hypothetical protein IBX61_07415 [Thermoleophilia bacterium]|nr:hypothetical protein [Thermoleophilia bacterium]